VSEITWDDRKKADNPKKHDGVSFDEGQTIFFDPLVRYFEDSHPETETERSPSVIQTRDSSFWCLLSIIQDAITSCRLESQHRKRGKPMKKEYNLKKMKQIRRPALDPKETKVAMTLRIDGDVILWLRQEAERTGIPYQTLLNSKLRESMTLPDRVKSLVDQRVEEILASKRAS
jgi:uncharacterized protein (DUF4415 family)